MKKSRVLIINLLTFLFGIFNIFFLCKRYIGFSNNLIYYLIILFFINILYLLNKNMSINKSLNFIFKYFIGIFLFINIYFIITKSFDFNIYYYLVFLFFDSLVFILYTEKKCYFSLIRSIILFVLFMVFGYVLKNVEAFYILSVICYAFTFYNFEFKDVKFKPEISFKFDKELLFVFISIVSTYFIIYTPVHILVLNNYGTGYYIVNSLLLSFRLLSILVLFFITLCEEREKINLSLIINVIICSGLFLILIEFLFYNSFMNYLFGTSFYEYKAQCLFLNIGGIVYALCVLMMYLFIREKKFKIIFIMNGSMIVGFVLLSIWLVRKRYLMGTAYSFLICSLLSFFLYFSISNFFGKKVLKK